MKEAGQCAMLPPRVHPSGAVYAAVDERAPVLRVASLADAVPVAPVARARPAPPVASAPRRVARMSELWPEGRAAAIKRRLSLLDLFPDAAPSGGGGRWYLARCPFHDDAAPSLRLDLRAGVAACFAGCTGGRALDVIAVHARLYGLTDGQAISHLARRLGL